MTEILPIKNYEEQRSLLRVQLAMKYGNPEGVEEATDLRKKDIRNDLTQLQLAYFRAYLSWFIKY